MNEDKNEISSDMQQSNSQPMNSPTPQKPKSKRSVLIAIIAVVVVVIVVVIAVVTVLPSTSSNPHFGFVSVNIIDNIAGTTLTQTPVSNLNITLNGIINTPPNSVIKEQAMEYNSTSGCSVIITVIQFSNVNGATNFYNNDINTLKNETLIYGSYKTFDYVYVSVTYSSFYEGLAVGHTGQFVFAILDVDIPLSNLNNLVQDQINAMT